MPFQWVKYQGGAEKQGSSNQLDPEGEAFCTGERTVYIVCAFKTKQAREMVGALMNIGREGEKL